MKSLAKLKDEARRFEQEEAWSKAIDVYLRVLQQSDSGGAEIELPLYNRIGDLYVRLGEAETAVAYYEDAAERYAEAGLFNNAIALCNKALRYAPERIELLRKLGQFSASQGFLTDARGSYLEYAERMFRKGDLDEAFAALEDFANLSEDATIRELLGRKLQSHGRSAQAVEELKRAYAMRLAAGEQAEADALREEIYAIDPQAGDLAAVAAAPRRRKPSSFMLPGLVELADEEDVLPADATVGEDDVDGGMDDGSAGGDAAPAGGTATVAGLESGGGDSEDVLVVGALEGLETTDLGGLPLLDEDEAVELPDAGDALPAAEPPMGVDTAGGEGDDAIPFDLPGFDSDDAAYPTAEDVDEPLPLLAFDGETSDGDDFAELGVIELPAADLPVDEVIARAHAAAADGRRADAVRMLAELLERIDHADSPAEAVRVLDRLVELQPDEVRYHQQRVEAMVRTTESGRLVESYLALAGAFERSGSAQHARMVHQQVLELDPDNAAALRALGRAAAPSAAGGYVDLGALLADEDDASGTTRFYVAEKEPTGDEDRDFAELLAQFKEKIAQNIEPEDAGSHYDLGLAYKEMGLVDEAIAAFQVALRSGDERLKIYEELGQCFVAKGQHNIAVKVLSRGLEGRRDDELALIGVFYYLARAYEELGRADDARDAYERVIALDVGFQDAAQRLGRL